MTVAGCWNDYDIVVGRWLELLNVGAGNSRVNGGCGGGGHG